MKLLLLALLLSCQMLTALAYDVKVNNLFYNLDREHHTATVTSDKHEYNTERTDYQGKIIVPNAIEAEGEKYLVSAIADSAFMGCQQLTSITLPSAIKVIGNSAFSQCSQLEVINFPNMLQVIGSRAFYGCQSIITAIIPNQVTTIGAEAFCYCRLLMNVYIPPTVTQIGYDAFYGCELLNNVYLADMAAWCGIDFGTIYSNPVFYAKRMTAKGKLVTDLVIPQKVTDIKPYAFVSCYTLNSLKLSNATVSIGEMAFYDCQNLLEISIPASMQHVGYQAFKFCSNAGAIYLFNPDTRLEEGAFDFCSGSLHVMKGHKEQYAQDHSWEDFMVIDDVPPLCASPVITYADGQLHLTSSTPGATCHLLQTFGEVEPGKHISDLPLSAYATAEGYQPSNIVTVWLKDVLTNPIDNNPKK